MLIEAGNSVNEAHSIDARCIISGSQWTTGDNGTEDA